MYFYDADGQRRPLDVVTAGRLVGHCLLCGDNVVVVGAFHPESLEARCVVLTLRNQPEREGSTPCVVYGLCAVHWAWPDDVRTEAIENRFYAAARAMRVA
jgi:hypothetical protein